MRFDLDLLSRLLAPRRCPFASLLLGCREEGILSAWRLRSFSNPTLDNQAQAIVNCSAKGSRRGRGIAPLTVDLSEHQRSNRLRNDWAKPLPTFKAHHFLKKKRQFPPRELGLGQGSVRSFPLSYTRYISPRAPHGHPIS